MFHQPVNRRSFLKFSLASALMLFGAKPVLANNTFTADMPEGKLSLYNVHTSERLTVTYRKQGNEYDLEALKDLNWLLRCHHTNQTINMDPKVIDYLNIVDKQFGGDNEIHIISGYRSPEYNSLLRKKGRQVASKSLHKLGKALDFFIPHVSLKNLQTAALSLQYGGVGYYPQTGFVHIDSGNFRTW
jgi:uncharacterized protein YcbK (DUF882 family)